MSTRWTRFRSRLWRSGKLILLGFLIAGGIYWVKFSPLTVTQHTIEQGPIIAEVMGTGTIEARVSVMTSPKIFGRIKNVLVDQGSQVKANDLLVQLEDAEYQQQVAIAIANLDVAKAAMARLTADKGRAQIITSQAQRRNRTKQSLLAQNVATQDEVDSAVEALAIAEAGLSRSEAAIIEGRNLLIAAEKTLEYHRARLTDTQILAPFDGLIVRRRREAGDIVVPGSAILTLISTKELWIRAWVDETEMGKLEVGQPARVVFRSDPTHSYPGTVARLGKEADRETREFIVDVQVLGLPKNWAVGQRAEVFIQTAQKQSVPLLPAAYVQWENKRPGVFVNVQGRVQWRELTLGLRSLDTVEIVAGLQAQDIVLMPAKAGATLPEGRRVSSP